MPFRVTVTPFSHGVPTGGGFDFDYFCSVVSEELTGERTSNKTSEFQDSDSREWTSHANYPEGRNRLRNDHPLGLRDWPVGVALLKWE